MRVEVAEYFVPARRNRLVQFILLAFTFTWCRLPNKPILEFLKPVADSIEKRLEQWLES